MKHSYFPTFHTERPAAWYPIGLSGEANQRFSKAKGEPPKQDMSRETSGYVGVSMSFESFCLFD